MVKKKKKQLKRNQNSSSCKNISKFRSMALGNIYVTRAENGVTNASGV